MSNLYSLQQEPQAQQAYVESSLLQNSPVPSQLYASASEVPSEFRGELEVSEQGVHPVIVYDIPGSRLCYVFQYHKKSSKADTALYRCYGCKKQNKKYTSVAIFENLFDKDPCLLSHNCIPVDRHKDKANRVAYESCQNIKNDPKLKRTTPNIHFNETAFQILKSSWRTLEARKKVLANFVQKGYGNRRSSFTRATSSRIRRVEMNDVPEELRTLPTDEDFLQLQLPDLHVYYSDEIIAAFIEIGLKALIGDGVHKLNPITIQSGIEKGQLYTVHAMCGNGFEVPILLAISRKKNRAVYKSIFECLKEKVADGNIRIILDYEKVN